jgi:hypothetical protein
MSYKLINKIESIIKNQHTNQKEIALKSDLKHIIFKVFMKTRLISLNSAFYGSFRCFL